MHYLPIYTNLWNKVLSGIFYCMKEIIGRLEKIDLPEFNLQGITAKIDTGAYSGAIHVSSVEEVIEDGKNILKFKILDKDHPDFSNKIYQAENFEKKVVKSSIGEAEKRFLIPIKVVLKGKEINAKLGLSNRKDLKYPILLGRRSIRKNFVVDVEKKFTDNNN